MRAVGTARAVRTARTAAVCALAGAAAFTALPALADATRGEGAGRDAASATGRSPAVTADPALRRFVEQRPRWEKCGQEGLYEAGARCTTVRVPLDYRKPDGRTLPVTFSRIKATSPEKRLGLMMHNSGGPGGRSLDMPLLSQEAMGKELADRFDLIGMDPRGVGRSSALDCDVPGHWLRSAGYDEAGFRAHAAYQVGLVRACQRAYGPGMAYLRHFTTRNTARDMDLIRAMLGERKTSYYGISYGTYLGAVYARMFPGNTARLLLDSAIDPARWYVQSFADADVANEDFLDTWAAWAARRHDTYGLGRTRAQVRATVEGIARQAARKPLTVGKYTADGQQVPAVLASSMADDRDFAKAAKTIRLLYDAAHGRDVEPDETLALILGPPDAEFDTQIALQMALTCGDREAPHDLSWYRRNVERSRAESPLYGPLFNSTHPCAFWPSKPVERPVREGNDVPGLIVQATGDPRTSYANGVGLHRKMPNSRLITFKARVHGVYGTYPNRCTYQQVNDYLRTGVLPSKDTVCGKDPAGAVP